MPPQLEASKWLDFLFLVSEKELARFFERLGPVVLYRSKGLFKPGVARMTIEELLKVYRGYLEGLQKGEQIDLDPFYLYISKEDMALYHRLLEDGREQIYPVLPCLVAQPGKIVYSPLDASFRNTAFTEDPILWGIKLSYPQIYLDPLSRELSRADRPPSPNAPLLKELRQWIRDETFPVAFEAEGKRQQTEFRLGNEIKDIKHTAMEKRGLFVSRT